MTSVKSSADTFGFTFWRTFKKAWMMPMLLLIQLLASVPFSAGGIFNTISGYNELKLSKDFDSELYFAAHKFVFLDLQPYDISLSTIIMQVFLIGIPVLLAVQIFRFVASKKMVNVYYSLGITRKNMFMAKYLCGATMLTAAIFIPIAVSAIANAVFFGVCREMVLSHLYFFLNYEVLAMVCFGMTVITLSSVGSVAEGMVYSGILLLTPTAIIETIEGMMRNFLYGAPFGKSYRVFGEINYQSSSVISQKRWLNPLASLIMGEEKGCYKYILEDVTKPDSHEWVMPNFTYAAVWGIAAVLVFFIGLTVFQKRKAEISGFLGSNRLLTGVCVFFTGMGTSAIFFKTSGGSIDKGIYLAIAFAFIFVSYTVASIVLYRSIKGYFKRIYMVLPHFAIYTALALVFISGLFGYSSKIPEKSVIKSVAISTGTANSLVLPGSAYMDNYYYYSDSVERSKEEDALVESGMRAMSAINLHTYDESVVGNLTSQNSIDFVMKIHKELIGLKGLNYSDNCVNNPDLSKRPIGMPVWIVYELKDGTTFERRYDTVTPEILDKLSEVQNSDEYKKLMLDVFSLPEVDEDGAYIGDDTLSRFAQNGSIGLCSANLINRTELSQFNGDMQLRKELLAAIREDISAGRVHADTKSDKPAIGYICVFDPSWNTFTANGKKDDDANVKIFGDDGELQSFTLSANSYLGCLPVYEDMASTIAFLTQNGLIGYFADTQRPVKARICRLGDMSGVKRLYEGHFSGCTSEIAGSVYYYDLGNSVFPADSMTFTQDKAAEVAANTRYSGNAVIGGAYVELIYADGTVAHGYISGDDIPQ